MVKGHGKLLCKGICSTSCPEQKQVLDIVCRGCHLPCPVQQQHLKRMCYVSLPVWAFKHIIHIFHNWMSIPFFNRLFHLGGHNEGNWSHRRPWWEPGVWVPPAKMQMLITHVEAEVFTLSFKWAENMTFPTGFNRKCLETNQQNYITDLSSVCQTSNFTFFLCPGPHFAPFLLLSWVQLG